MSLSKKKKKKKIKNKWYVLLVTLVFDVCKMITEILTLKFIL